MICDFSDATTSYWLGIVKLLVCVLLDILGSSLGSGWKPNVNALNALEAARH